MLKRNKQQRDVFGLISTLVLLAVLYGTFVYVFYRFAKMYLGTTFDESPAEMGPKRVYELMTLVYGVVILLNTLVGVKKIYSALVGGQDAEVLLCQPISGTELFVYKLLKIYGAQLVSGALVLVPAVIVVDVLSAYAGGAGYYVAMLSHLILVPLMSCALASLIAIPFNSVMRYIGRKFVLHLVLYIVVIGVGFWLYSLFLKVLSDLLQTGDLQFLFNRMTITRIGQITQNAYPINLMTNMLTGTWVWQSVLIVLGIALVSGGVTFAIIRTMFTRILQRKMEGEIKVYNRKHRRFRQKSPVLSLMYKELLVILRTPSYAFQYFATTFTLPLMVYVCVNLMRNMMSTLTVLNCDYEIAIFVIAMFSILTNTFCTTNISRDGHMLGMLKTLPIKGSTVIAAKIGFCMIVAEISILSSLIVLLAVGSLLWWQALIIFVLASMMAFAEVAFATRKDLGRPSIPSNDKEEVQEGNSNVSTVAFLGLVISLILGGGAVALSAVLGLLYSAGVAIGASIAFVFVLVSIVFALSCVYLFRGLNKKFYEAE